MAHWRRSYPITNLWIIWKLQPMMTMRSVMICSSLDSCKYNVLVDWGTGEKTYEPLSVLAADDPVTCAMYAKENDLLHID